MKGVLHSPPLEEDAATLRGSLGGMDRFSSPLALLDALKEGDEHAYETLLQLFERLRHPSLFAARSPEARRSIARDFLHEFLAARPTWTAERLLEVKSFGLFRRDIEKFLFGHAEGGGRIPGSEARQWLRQKLDRILASARFEKDGGENGRSVRYRLRGVPPSEPIAESEQELLKRLPQLRPRLIGAREGRLPSYASDAEIEEVLSSIFRFNGNAYLYKKRLIVILLRCFDPPLESFEYRFQIHDVESLRISDRHSLHHDLDFEIDLSKYEEALDELLSDDERALLSRFEDRGSVLAQLFGVSEARISQRRDALGSRLLSFAKTHQLSRAEMRLLLGIYLARMEFRDAR